MPARLGGQKVRDATVHLEVLAWAASDVLTPLVALSDSRAIRASSEYRTNER